jgi:hypothetical protein
MGRKIHPIEREVDEIRLGIYERTKHMSPEELNEYFRKNGEETAKKYGFKLIDNVDDI